MRHEYISKQNWKKRKKQNKRICSVIFGIHCFRTNGLRIPTSPPAFPFTHNCSCLYSIYLTILLSQTTSAFFPANFQRRTFEMCLGWKSSEYLSIQYSESFNIHNLSLFAGSFLCKFYMKWPTRNMNNTQRSVLFGVFFWTNIQFTKLIYKRVVSLFGIWS